MSRKERRELSSRIKMKPLPGTVIEVDDIEQISHPNHYAHFPIEPIDAIRIWELNFNLGNVVKYVVRADLKGTPLKDLRKAGEYIRKEIEFRESHDKEKAGD